MNTPFAFTLAMFAASMLITPHAIAIDKLQYDLRESVSGSAAGFSKASFAAGLGWKIKGSVGELAVSPGGYFTIGATGGLSPGTLDDHCGVTFGHPFARTSYAVMSVDGVWGTVGEDFSPDSEWVEGGNDSLVLTYRMAGLAMLRLVFAADSSGSAFVVRSTLRNLDTVNHTLALGFAFDPGLGIRGDGTLSIDGVPVVRDTMLLAVGGMPLVIKERSTSPPGLRVSLGFPDLPPDKLIVANWADRENVDGPIYISSAVRSLYDLDLHMSWQAQQVSAGDSLSRSLAVTILPPDFGQGVFVRWDLPDHVQMDDGIAFPVSLQSTVTASNLASYQRTGTVAVLQSTDVTFDTTARAVTLSSNGTSYARARASISELYEDRVISLVAAYSEEGGFKDSLIHRLFIPATPVADTGLVVAIDSIAATHFPEVTAFVTVKREATGQYITALAQRNMTLYDNATRINDIAIQRDTTGGTAQSDIVFVLDVTGSMSGAIDGVKNSILEFADSLEARGVIYRLGLVTFRDEVDHVFDFTTDAVAFKALVSAQIADGGGDGPENSLDALYRASQLSFSPTTRHIIIWITDNSYHEADEVTSRVRADVIARLLETNIIVYAIGELLYQTDWYNPIVNATGGKYYNYLGNFRDILVDIGRANTSRRLMLTYTAPQAPSTIHAISLTVHYAGRGGTTSSSYEVPGGAAAVVGLACYPNPFNPLTTLRLDLPKGTSARLALCDYLGREVRHFLLPPGDGTKEIVWDARDERGREVATGVYFVRATIISPTGRCIGNAVTKLLYLK